MRIYTYTHMDSCVCVCVFVTLAGRWVRCGRCIEDYRSSMPNFRTYMFLCFYASLSLVLSGLALHGMWLTVWHAKPSSRKNLTFDLSHHGHSCIVTSQEAGVGPTHCLPLQIGKKCLRHLLFTLSTSLSLASSLNSPLHLPLYPAAAVPQ